MSGSNPTYAATLTAQDGLSPVLLRVAQMVDEINSRMSRLPRAAEEATASTPWQRLNGQLSTVRANLGKISGAYDMVVGRAAAFVPALAGLGGLTAIGGVFKLTEGVAEKTALFQRTADRLGIATGVLARFGYVARMTDTDMESFTTGIARFNVTVGKAAGGADKNAAMLFSRLGISLKNARGELRPVEDLMADVMKAFRVNPNINVRSVMARTFFGRGGQDMMPMLTLERERLDALEESRNKLRFKMTPEERTGLTEYHDAWLELEFAVSQVGTSIGAKLAPRLRPVLTHMRDWVANNREFIAQGVASKIDLMADAIDRLDVDKLVTGARAMVGLAAYSAEQGGNALEKLMRERRDAWQKDNVVDGREVPDRVSEELWQRRNLPTWLSNLLLGSPNSGPAAYFNAPVRLPWLDLPSSVYPMRVEGGTRDRERVGGPVPMIDLSNPFELLRNPADPYASGGQYQVSRTPLSLPSAEEKEINVNITFDNAPAGMRASVDSRGNIAMPRVNLGPSFPGER